MRLVVMGRDAPAWNCLRCGKDNYVCCDHPTNEWRTEDVDSGGGMHCQRCKRFMCEKCLRDKSYLSTIEELGDIQEAQLLCQQCGNFEQRQRNFNKHYYE